MFYPDIVKNVTISLAQSGALAVLMHMKPEAKPNTTGLTLSEITTLLAGQVICGDDRLDETISSACGCDLMSDVLAFTRPGSILLTGLTNAQVVRTAEMLDLKAIVFVRDKRPDELTIQMAKAMRMVLILSPYPLYESCGRLFAAGLAGCQDCTHAEPHPAAEG